jgi:DNA (cytosine-5)-methyltransferase 1
MDEGLIIDLFAGGGGASKGLEAALGRPVDIALNHSATALAVHAKNHPKTVHLVADVWKAKPREVTGGKPVYFLWASPDCTHHSRAKGGKPRQQKIRSLPYAVVRWAREVRPEYIALENVPEYEGWGPLLKNGKPNPRRKGKHFRHWVGELRRFGYNVEWRQLLASDFGTPQDRKRFFLVARRDGLPIAWPDVTHGKGREPKRTAADDVIDWSLPCPSIFLTRAQAKALKLKVQRPLKSKTMWRIAQGLKRFVFDNPRPFIIKVNHGKWEARSEGIDEPLSTVTATQRGHALVAPVLQQSGYGERKGQAARTLNIHQPLGTIVDGQKHALVQAFLVKHFGDPLRTDGGGGVVVGSDLNRPIGTVTGTDHHSLAAVTLAKFRGTSDAHHGAADPREPLPTVSAGGDHGGVHIAEVRAFLVGYYGNDGTGGQQLTLPLRTVTSRDRLGLVMVAGTEYQIVDIGLRMLQPHELLRAQFGKYAPGYDLSAATTKKAKVKLIGNSVCPEVAEAVVRANVHGKKAVAA